jgi:hypothetical protein
MSLTEAVASYLPELKRTAAVIGNELGMPLRLV